MPEKLLSIWWFRIIAFLIIALAITLAAIPFADDSLHAIIVSLSLLISTVVVEQSRKSSIWYAAGLRPDKFAIRDIMIALAITLISMLIFFITFYIAGFEIKIDSLPEFETLRAFMIIMVVGVIFEELLFRGIIFQSLISKFSPVLVVIILSIAFSAIHYWNPNVSAIALVNIFIANLLISAMYLATGSLVMPIAFHFFWNVSQQLFLSSPVSGGNFNVYLFLIDFENRGGLSELVIGGEFGIEEGLMTTVILILWIPVVLKISKQSPFLNAIRFKRDRAESILTDNRKKI